MSSRRCAFVPAKPAKPHCKKGELMSFSKKLCGVMGAVGLSLLAAAPALAAPIKAPDAAAMAGMVNKGDVAWMLVSAALVLMMSVPGLALFYGGLVRTKNMLSILMQVVMIVSVAGLVWCCWGYSIARSVEHTSELQSLMRNTF